MTQLKTDVSVLRYTLEELAKRVAKLEQGGQVRRVFRNKYGYAIATQICSPDADVREFIGFCDATVRSHISSHEDYPIS